MNAAGEHASADATTVPITTWQGPVEVQRSVRIPVSAFAEQLLSEPEHEIQGMPRLERLGASMYSFPTALPAPSYSCTVAERCLCYNVIRIGWMRHKLPLQREANAASVPA